MARTDRATWAKRVQRWGDSGLKAPEYAAEIGVNPRTLAYWKWRLGAKPAVAGPKPVAAKSTSAESPTSRKRVHRSRSTPPLSFVELTRAAAPVVSEPFELVFARGVRIRVPTAFDADALVRLLDVMERRA